MVAVDLVTATRQPALTAMGRARKALTVGDLCSAIESGALPADRDADEYVLGWRQLQLLAARRAFSRVRLVRAPDGST